MLGFILQPNLRGLFTVDQKIEVGRQLNVGFHSSTQSTRAIALTVESEFIVPGFDDPSTRVGQLVQALENGNYDNSLFNTYAVYTVTEYDQNPAEIVLVNVDDGSLRNNQSYAQSHLFNHTDNEEFGEYAFTSSYAMVLRDGELQYIPVGQDFQLQAGDKVLFEESPDLGDGPFISAAETRPALPVTIAEDLVAEDSPLFTEILAPLYRTSKFGAEFVLGAVYQLLLDIPDSVYSTTALFVNLTNKVFLPYSDLSIPSDAVDNAAEYYLEDQYLNQTFAFRAGRVAGDLVSLGFGILEMIAGTAIATGGSIGGGLLSATGLGALVGAPVTALSLEQGVL